MPSSTLKSNLLNTRTARLAAGSVVVVGALMATLSGVNAWADRGQGHEHQAREHRGHGMHAVAHRHGGDGMGSMMPGGRMLERLLDDVKATDTQRTQIDKIQSSAREDIARLHEQHSKLRQQTVQLLTAPTVDTAAIEKVRLQMLQQHDAISKRMLTAMVDSSKVLTPEQRSTLSARLKERQERMDERRERGHEGKRQDGTPPTPPKG